LQAVQLGFNPQITQISQITDEMGEKSERHIAVETQDIVSLHVSTGSPVIQHSRGNPLWLPFTLHC
ncbi:MAG: hypothetical protein ABIJ30_07475, partial [bacterium]